MISVVKTQCTEFTHLAQCIEPLVVDYHKCLKPKDVELVEFIGKFSKKMLGYLCAGDGQTLTDLINHGVVSCLMSKFVLTKQCLGKLMTTFTNFENMVSYNIEKDICRFVSFFYLWTSKFFILRYSYFFYNVAKYSTLTDTQACIVNLVRTCPDPMLVTKVEDLFVHVEQELTCSSFV